MSEARYKIVFDGQLMPDTSVEQARERLARLFKSDPERIAALFSGAPATIKRDLSHAEAEQYLQALRQAGALARKEQDLASSLSLVSTEDHKPAASAAVEDMTCPKCGHQQDQASMCNACGIVIEKYLARQAQLAEQAASSPVVETPASPDSSASPYSAPQANLAGEEAAAELRPFSTSGRIGRVRYLGWSMALGLLAIAGYLIAALLMAVHPVIGGLLMVPVAIGTLWVSVLFGVQRLHDIGWSGWLWLLNLVPMVGGVFALLLLIVPGSQGGNSYGPPPPPNSKGVVAMAWCSLLAPVLIGIIAAIAIPAYQDYSQRAQHSAYSAD